MRKKDTISKEEAKEKQRRKRGFIVNAGHDPKTICKAIVKGLYKITTHVSAHLT